MLGGVTVNFILAFIIYIGMTFFYGEQYIANSEVKDGIWITNPVVEKAGLKTGDKLISIDGEKVERFYESNEKLFLSKEIIVLRDGKEEKVHFPVNFIDQLMQGKRASLVELRIPFVVSAVADDSPNKAVLKPKDMITSFNGKPVKYADEIIKAVDSLKGKTIPVIIKRDNKEIATTLKVNDSARLGAYYANRIMPYEDLSRLGLYKVSEEKFGFFESITVGINKGFEQLSSYGKQLKAIFSPSTGAYKGVGGFAAIFNIFPNTWSWEAFWGITALLSIMLGVMNLLPIPALDGGHVMFLLYEIISGRKPSDKFLERAQMVGFVLLISLLLFANGNDIYKAIFNK
jgi:regulator of sigma E protease